MRIASEFDSNRDARSSRKCGTRKKLSRRSGPNVTLRTGRRPSLHARPQGIRAQYVHFVHLADVHGGHCAGRRGADRRAVCDERVPAGTAQSHPVGRLAYRDSGHAPARRLVEGCGGCKAEPPCRWSRTLCPWAGDAGCGRIQSRRHRPRYRAGARGFRCGNREPHASRGAGRPGTRIIWDCAGR